jgi:hypothetical protein
VTTGWPGGGRPSRVEVERSDRARELLDIILEGDPKLRKMLGAGRVRHITSGAGSDVFTFGADRVVKIISHADDCNVAALLWDEGGKVPGWPIIYDFADLDDKMTYPLGWDESVCLAVVERVLPADELSERNAERMGEVMSRLDLMHEVHLGMREQSAIDLDDTLNPLDKEQQKWVAQLAEGLTAIDRWDEDTSLDFWSFGNVGLNTDRQAVWVDFGI